MSKPLQKQPLFACETPSANLQTVRDFESDPTLQCCSFRCEQDVRITSKRRVNAAGGSTDLCDRSYGPLPTWPPEGAFGPAPKGRARKDLAMDPERVFPSRQDRGGRRLHLHPTRQHLGEHRLAASSPPATREIYASDCG